MSDDAAKDLIRATLDSARSLLAQVEPPKLSEADTKANFIEPIIAALGWQGIGQVTREFHVKSSGEYIDFLLRGPSGPVLAIEAKPLQAELTEKAAAQLVQYCVIEGIEWAALTNARELQYFNTFLKGNLESKRVITLDLLAFTSDDEFDILFDMLFRLSRRSLTSADARQWLNRKRLDAAMRDMLLDQQSAVVRLIRRNLNDLDIKATPSDITHWVHETLSGAAPKKTIASSSPAPSPRKALNTAGPTEPVAGQTPDADSSVAPGKMPVNFGVKLRDLVEAGFLEPDAQLVLVWGGADRARARLMQDGSLQYDGQIVKSLSDKRFAQLLGNTSLNGWTAWYVESTQGRTQLANVRSQFLETQAAGG